jgi:hypothetical protein
MIFKVASSHKRFITAVTFTLEWFFTRLNMKLVPGLTYMHFLVTHQFACLGEGLAAIIRKAAVLVSVNFVEQK